jgi:CRP-like cAMP-binding protein
MLQTYDLKMFFIEKVGSARVLRQVLVINLQSNSRRIIIGMSMVGHRHYAGIHIYARLGNCLLKVSGKGGDSAAAREGVANECQAVGGSQEETARSGAVQVIFMMCYLCGAKRPKKRDAKAGNISSVATFHGKTLKNEQAWGSVRKNCCLLSVTQNALKRKQRRSKGDVGYNSPDREDRGCELARRPCANRRCSLVMCGTLGGLSFLRAPALSTAENHLIELLPAKDRRRLLGIAEHVQLAQSDVLGETGKPIRHIYFPVDGFISLVTSIEGKPVLEVGMVGREGLLGAQVALRVLTQPLHALVQGSGTARRVSIRAFRSELDRCVPLQRLIGRYLYVLMTQLASSAACTRFHQIDARLGRWLLMMQDRAHDDTFGVTHEFLAYMLGVRRVGITIAAVALQKKGLIEYRRGKVTVLNRKGLETAACSCYRDDNQIYARIMH